jgi:dephospho-CoA kinase
MFRVGLTGGIGCGKSTVAAMMRALGCHVLDADKMAHALIEPGKPAYDEIVRHFGRNILATDGSIDRARLAAIVFADPEQLRSLNAIVHPPVLRELDGELERISRLDPSGIAVIEAALLIEAGYHHRLDRLVLVTCTPEQQFDRLTNPAFGRAMSRDQAEKRIAAQMPLAEKRKLPHDAIDCSGSLDDTKRQVLELIEEFKHAASQQR